MSAAHTVAAVCAALTHAPMSAFDPLHDCAFDCACAATRAPTPEFDPHARRASLPPAGTGRIGPAIARAIAAIAAFLPPTRG